MDLPIRPLTEDEKRKRQQPKNGWVDGQRSVDLGDELGDLPHDLPFPDDGDND